MSDKENNNTNNSPRNLHFNDGSRTENQKKAIKEEEAVKQNNINIINTKNEEKYGETPYRWFFLISYCLICFVNQLQWV